MNQVVEDREILVHAAEMTTTGKVLRFPQVDDHATSSARGVQSNLVTDVGVEHSARSNGRRGVRASDASPLPLGSIVPSIAARMAPSPVGGDDNRATDDRTDACGRMSELGADRTVAGHGLTRPEVKRISDGRHYMRTMARRKRGSDWKVIGVDIAPGTSGADIEYFRRRLTTIQGEAGVAQLWLSVTETDPGVHQHFIAVVNSQALEKLTRAPKFNSLTARGAPAFHFKPDHANVALYLTKEATTQAAYKNQGVPYRKPGSHKLPGGGDRVRVSDELAKHVDPWKRANRKRVTERKPYRQRRLFPNKAPVHADQVVLPFTEPQVRRPVARLRDFGGGLVPRVVAEEIEFRRHQLGWSQRELAGRCGISQPQLANALRGHDPVSAWVTNRLHEILLDRVA